MQIGNMFIIPHFVSARTPELLQQAMLTLNMSKGKQYKFFDISFANGLWYAWYLESKEDSIAPKLRGNNG